MVFQNYALYPHMSVRDNIGFSLRLSKTPKDEIVQRVDEAAKVLELTEQLDKKPGQISGGQRQRVAIGRAIVREPLAFLMDEPLSNLDAELRVQMRAEIARLQRDLGVTTIYVTHDQVETMTTGDRVAVLKDGHLQQVVVPEELYRRPSNVFVAAFIGSPSMNLHEATLRGTKLELGSHELTLPDSVFASRPALRDQDGSPVIVGIRPEDFEDAALATADRSTSTVAAKVTLTEALGPEIIVHFTLDAPRVDPGDPDAVDELSEHTAVGRFDPRSRVATGETIHIAVNCENLHFFDPSTRLNLLQ